MNRANRITLGVLIGLVVTVALVSIARFALERGDADQAIARVDKVQGMGATRSFSILPLLDRNTAGADLVGEAGLAYLIRTDTAVILFDLGLNSTNAEPSALSQNMDRLGIARDGFDIVVLSHKHADHLGGTTWQKSDTFSLGNRQVDLSGKRVYVPEPMTYPGLIPIVVRTPTIIANGAASMGPLAFADMIPTGPLPQEQSLAINVEGKGIVLITGSGHPTLPNIIARAEALFDAPVAGVVGGLHYGNSDGKDIVPVIDFLRARSPRLVALSPHDSNVAAVQAFREAFPGVYRDIVVGQVISFD